MYSIENPGYSILYIPPKPTKMYGHTGTLMCPFLFRVSLVEPLWKCCWLGENPLDHSILGDKATGFSLSTPSLKHPNTYFLLPYGRSFMNYLDIINFNLFPPQPD